MNDELTTLDRLIESNKDCAAWFRIAADESFDSPELIGLFNSLSEERLVFVEQIEEILRSFGRAPAPPIARLLARAWRDTRSLMSKEASSLDVRMAKALALQGETLSEYERALRLRWPADARAVIERHVCDIRRDQQRLIVQPSNAWID